MMQGDAYGVSIEILDNSGNVVTESDVSDIEIVVGSLRKTYKNGEIFFVDNGDGSPRWVIPLSQKETFKFPISRVNVQIRVAWSNGEVEGDLVGQIVVSESRSKEVL